MCILRKIVALNEMIILFILLKKNMVMNDLAYFSTLG